MEDESELICFVEGCDWPALDPVVGTCLEHLPEATEPKES